MFNVHSQNTRSYDVVGELSNIFKFYSKLLEIEVYKYTIYTLNVLFCLGF